MPTEDKKKTDEASLEAKGPIDGDQQETIGKLTEQLADQAARIKDLEEQLLAAKAQAKSESDKHDFQTRRADKLEADLSAAKKSKGPKMPAGDFVQLENKIYDVLTTVRADNTFVEVKRGYVSEGATMVVIDKVH